MIETQISFSSSIALKKNELFLRRVKKLNCYFFQQIVLQSAATLTIGWLYYYGGYCLVSLLVYPVHLASLDLPLALGVHKRD